MIRYPFSNTASTDQGVLRIGETGFSSWCLIRQIYAGSSISLTYGKPIRHFSKIKVRKSLSD